MVCHPRNLVGLPLRANLCWLLRLICPLLLGLAVCLLYNQRLAWLDDTYEGSIPREKQVGPRIINGNAVVGCDGWAR